ncbi:MAG: FtsX-like permease family protein [Thermoproteota archaeon]
MSGESIKVRYLTTILIVLTISATLTFLLLPVSGVFAQADSQTGNETNILANILLPFFEEGGHDRIMSHVKYLTSLKSRMPGHEGFLKAADYIVDYLKEIGVEPYSDSFFENYTLTSYVDWGVKITLEDGTQLDAYMLQPNFLNTNSYKSPPEWDKVVYVGETLEGFDGKDIAGKFVVMDFNSKWFFRYAMMFGAKGVIYTYPRDTFREEAFQKIYNNPVCFPRYLLGADDSRTLLDYIERNGGEATIWIDSKMTWERIVVPNIVGFIEGSDPKLKNETIVISAYYDSYSITPALSPGATESIGSSVLLEVTRFLVENRDKLNRSIIILFTSGHFQSLWGIREFVDRHFNEIGRDPKYGVSIKMFISLDLSYGSEQLAILNRGATYAYDTIDAFNARYMNLITTMLGSSKDSYLNKIRVALNNDTLYGAGFYDAIQLTVPAFSTMSLPVRFGSNAYECEPFNVVAGGGGFTLLTVNDFLQYYMTPLDTFDKVNFRNVFRQAYFIAGISLFLSHDIELPLSAGRAIRWSDEWGFATLNITVSTYNFTKDFFDPITKETNPSLWNDVVVYYSGTKNGRGTGRECLGAGSTGTFSVIVKPDENGVATIKGLKPYTGDVSSYFFALAVNSTNGSVHMALDWGYRFGAGGRIARTDILISSPNVGAYAPLFECGSIILQGIVNPRDLSGSLNPTIYNSLSHGSPVRWSKWTGSTVFGDHVFFVEVREPIEIVIFHSGTTAVWSVLNNMTGKDLRSGYRVKSKGDQIVINYGPLACAEGLYTLNDARVSTAMNYGVTNPTVLLYHNLSQRYLTEALEMLKNKVYSKAYGFSYPFWSYEQKAYFETRILVENVIATTALFFILVIPFAYVFERLVFGYMGLRRVLIIISISVILTIVLLAFHPSFHLANNLLMILVSLAVTVFIIILLAFFSSETVTTTRIASSKIIGTHFAESTTGTVFSAALSLGIQWMRKRPFRTILTLTSITLITFALMTFTSLTSIAELKKVPPVAMEDRNINTPILYEGILIRNRPWNAIPIELFYQLKYELQERAYIVPRGWYYPPAGSGGRAFIYWNASRPLTRVLGVLALSPDEKYITQIDAYVRGRWFEESELYSVIISQSLAARLSMELNSTVTYGSQITIWGLNLTVIGLFDGNTLYSGGIEEVSFTSGLMDLDGEPITPKDPVVVGTGMGAIPPHLHGDDIIIIPFELALKILGPNSLQLISVAVKPFSELEIETLARELAYRLDTYVIYGLAKGVSLEGWILGDIWELTARTWFSFTGAESLIIPLIMSGLSILNLTIGTIYERIRSVSVYVVVGASPSQTAGIFLSESLVYGLLSSVLGYVFGMVGISVMIRLGLYRFTEFFPNFASSFIFIVIALAILIPLTATIYPALKAWQIVTPSLELKWKIPEPVGDYWTVPLPFVATSEAELMGILAFIREFLQAYSGLERTGLFSPEEISFNEHREGDMVVKRLHSRIRLAPFDLAIVEDFDVEAVIQKKRYTLTLYFVRINGIAKNWITSNKVFIDTIRKQLLLWRVMSPSVREHYFKEGEKLKDLFKKGEEQ